MNAFSNRFSMHRSVSLIVTAALLAILTAAPLAAQEKQAGQDRRAALVIGNSAYASNALANPVNDATDMAAALKELGFAVILRSDADLAGMEKALADFQALLRDKDVALFYYAGHGVQVQGENYLIPVKEQIDSEAKARSRGVALADVLERVKEAKVRTALVFLDACRDNPFPGSSRSGTRGLSLVSAPAELETLIAFATEPGSVAADGKGRNGVFTAAMLKNMGQAGLNIGELMMKVRADVMAQTGDRQKPRADVGLSKPFYFNDPAAAAARADAALAKSRAEVAELERQLKDRQAKIGWTKDAAARQALEVEQQRQQALQVAKKLEADNLAKEAERQKQAVALAQQISLKKQADEAAARQQQSELGNLAASRRAELEKLAQSGASDNPDVLIGTVERLETVLAEVDGQYAAVLQKSLAAVNASWDKQLASFQAGKPEIWESDAEFAARVAGEKQSLESRRQGELSNMRSDAEAQRLQQTAAIRKQFDDTLRTLETKTWTLTGSTVLLTVGAFDRNAKTWEFSVDSNDPMLPMLPISLLAKLGESADPKKAIIDLDTAVKAKALVGELRWGITRDAARKRYDLMILEARVKNLTSNAIVAKSEPKQRSAYFTAGKRSAPIQAGIGSIAISTAVGSGEAEVFIDGKKCGTAPLSLKLATGTIFLHVRWADLYSGFSQKVTIGEGRTTAINAKKVDLKVGDLGPAGGSIFYDKGRVTDGWRYLEAAPSNQSEGIQWYNGKYIDIKTATALGSGKANTVAILAAQGSGSYAAQLCADLNLGGFNDWFLPSKDELNLMYQNLEKVDLGGFFSAWYWSSSQSNDDVAWDQDFSGGQQYSGSKFCNGQVRAVRSF